MALLTKIMRCILQVRAQEQPYVPLQWIGMDSVPVHDTCDSWVMNRLDLLCCTLLTADWYAETDTWIEDGMDTFILVHWSVKGRTEDGQRTDKLVTEHLRFHWLNGLSVPTLPSEVQCSMIILGSYALDQFVRPILHYKSWVLFQVLFLVTWLCTFWRRFDDDINQISVHINHQYYVTMSFVFALKNSSYRICTVCVTGKLASTRGPPGLYILLIISRIQFLKYYSPVPHWVCTVLVGRKYVST